MFTLPGIIMNCENGNILCPNRCSSSYAGKTACLALSTSQNVTFTFLTFAHGRLSTNQTHSMIAPKPVINIHEPGELIQRWQRTGWSFIYLSRSPRPPCTLLQLPHIQYAASDAQGVMMATADTLSTSTCLSPR